MRLEKPHLKDVRDKFLPDLGQKWQKTDYGLRPATLLKNRLWHRYFPVNFTKFLRTPFFTEHLRWLLLKEDRRTPKRILERQHWFYFGVFIASFSVGKNLFKVNNKET